MKKLMIAVAVAAMAVAANAATYVWTNPYGLDAAGASNDSAMFSGDVYLMNEGELSQESFINTVLGASDMGTSFATLVASAFNTMDIADGEKSWDDSTTYGVDSEQTFYVAAFDSAKKAVYVSELTDPLTIPEFGEVYPTFYHDAAYAGTLFENATEFQGAGWYTASEGVPEPTSGLLMLVGLAGLALRRRRA